MAPSVPARMIAPGAAAALTPVATALEPVLAAAATRLLSVVAGCGLCCFVLGAVTEAAQQVAVLSAGVPTQGASCSVVIMLHTSSCSGRHARGYKCTSHYACRPCKCSTTQAPCMAHRHEARHSDKQCGGHIVEDCIAMTLPSCLLACAHQSASLPASAVLMPLHHGSFWH